jgi:GR25 family glycosyltransferase involved in LPS biosynthesis
MYLLNMKIFVVNLDAATDRWEQYENDDRFTRWNAWHYDDLPVTHPIFKEMVSMYNINPKEHKAKCACYISHTRLYEYIIKNKLDDVLIIEDDAELVSELPDSKKLPQDGFTYFGGFTSHLKMTQGPVKVHFDGNGIHRIQDDKYRMLMTVAIYIPNWIVAKKMLSACKPEKKRPRAIDTMLRDAYCPQYVYYPAPFIEKDFPSQIRKGKKKHSNQFYEWV